MKMSGRARYASWGTAVVTGLVLFTALGSGWALLLFTLVAVALIATWEALHRSRINSP
jgi:hypothetical protein